MGATTAKKLNAVGEPDSPRRLLTYAQYAAGKGVSVDTIRRMVRRGELEVVRVSPKCLRIIEVTA